MTDITFEDIEDLVDYFSKNTYQAKDADSKAQSIMQRCILLANLDYTHSIISNIGGELCAQYPSHLIILESEKTHPINFGDVCSHPNETINELICDTNKLREKIKEASIARCRERFPVPVLLYKNRYVCRSATLAGAAEVYGRTGFRYIYHSNGVAPEPKEENEDEFPVTKDWQMSEMFRILNNARHHDIELLKALNVGTINDLMVENKKQKFGIYVTSSEKIDKEQRYSDFTIISLPYPGCEFFQKLRPNNYSGENLFYDWSQYFVDAEINVPAELSSQLQIEWADYRDWDLITITQNYMQLIMRYLTDSYNSLLIHCISGWDRTPLFISLLRLSLWADGAIHKSLSLNQILYFTIAYDWFLFGHNLKDRLFKGEEIFYFCFYFLKYIYMEEYSVNTENDVFDVVDGEVMPASRLSIGSCHSLYSQNGGRDNQDNLPPPFFPIDSQEDELINGNIMLAASPNCEPAMNGSPRSPLPASDRTPPRPSNRTPPLLSMNNRTPPPQLVASTKRTSPVAVPVPRLSGALRQRTESSSSESSFCYVTSTGSLRSGSSLLSQGITMMDGMAGAGGHGLQESTATLIEEISYTSLMARRRVRLEKVRELFIRVYIKVIGLKQKDISYLTQVFGNFTGIMPSVTAQRSSSS